MRSETIIVYNSYENFSIRNQKDCIPNKDGNNMLIYFFIYKLFHRDVQLYISTITFEHLNAYIEHLNTLSSHKS